MAIIAGVKTWRTEATLIRGGIGVGIDRHTRTHWGVVLVAVYHLCGTTPVMAGQWAPGWPRSGSATLGTIEDTKRVLRSA